MAGDSSDLCPEGPAAVAVAGGSPLAGLEPPGCIDPALGAHIQSYIRREPLPEFVVAIEQHILDCPSCCKEVEDSWTVGDLIEKAVSEERGTATPIRTTVPEGVIPQVGDGLPLYKSNRLLASLRDARGWDESRAARALGMPVAQYRRLEKSDEPLAPAWAPLVARAYGLPPEETWGYLCAAKGAAEHGGEDTGLRILEVGPRDFYRVQPVVGKEAGAVFPDRPEAYEEYRRFYRLAKPRRRDLRRLKEAAGMKNVEFGRLAGLGPRSAENWLNRGSSPSFERLQVLRRACGPYLYPGPDFDG